MKKPLIFLCCSLFSIGFSFATSNELGDCGLFAQNTTPKASFVNSFDINVLYPEINRIIAVQNLKKYCCANYQNDATTQQRGCNNNQDNNYANSNLLYDHLIDVGFRSLDGDKDLAYAGEALDAVGQQRHNLLYGKDANNPGYANNPNGAIPVQVRKDFGMYWGMNDRGSVQYNLNDFIDPKDNTAQYQDYIKKRSTLPTSETPSSDIIGLASRYLILCHIAQQIVAKGGDENTGFPACQTIALKRINDEIGYVEYILSNQGMNALMSNFNAYTQGYFVQGELGRLLEKITEMNVGLTHINNKVSEITRMCSN